MSDRWFLFTQFEFPWELGPQDGRYLVRAGREAEPEHVIVLGTLGARKRPPTRGQLWSAATRSGSRKRPAEPEPEPEPVATARATIVDPVSVSAERQAKAWLAELDGEREIGSAIAALNRLLHFHRIAAADPDVREVAPEQAIVIRAGWGEGEQVADGLWTHAVELPWRGPGGVRRKRIGDRAAALRPQERLAVLLGGRGAALVCAELAPRAAYAAALAELPAEGREDLAIRIAELEKLRDGVEAQARAALADLGVEAPDSANDGGLQRLDEEVVRHALGRLEAALRARTATGFTLQ
jgi:cell division protein FtsB